MTTTIATWNEDEQKLIAVFQESLGMNRSNAIRKMRNELKKSGMTAGELVARGIAGKLQPKGGLARKTDPRAKKERQPKETGDCHLNEQQKEEVTKAVPAHSQVEFHRGIKTILPRSCANCSQAMRPGHYRHRPQKQALVERNVAGKPVNQKLRHFENVRIVGDGDKESMARQAGKR